MHFKGYLIKDMHAHQPQMLLVGFATMALSEGVAWPWQIHPQ